MKTTQKGKIIYTGNFWEWLGITILLLLATVFTFGLAGIYLAYWEIKYFVTHLEIELHE